MALQIGNAPCSWGVIENVAGERSGYERVLAEIQETGYTGTELGDWGFMPTDPVQLRAELAKYRLTLTGSWVNVYLSHNERYQESLDNCLRAARQLAKVSPEKTYLNLGDEVYEIPNRTLKAGRITAEDAMSPEQRRIFMHNLSTLCHTVEEETGVTVLFHHHVGTWIETPEEIDRMLNDTGVGICFDSGHCRFGGGDPLTMLKRYRERVGVVHFKDCKADVAAAAVKHQWNAFQSLEHGIFPELGKGDIHFPPLVAFLKETDYDGWIIVEQDVIPGMGNPKLSAKNNREYIRRLGL